jgi:hypothetical protein
VARITVCSSADTVRRFSMKTPESFMHLAEKG